MTKIHRLVSIDRRGAILESHDGTKFFVPTKTLDTEYLAFEHNSPKGPMHDLVILVPKEDLVEA